jgi:LuxR family maltose regulon positive regulatory protein
MDGPWALRGRLTPPSYRVALLPTAALRRLEAFGTAHRVVLVTAPAGYGKTALLAQWSAGLRSAGGVRTAWVSVSADQAEPAQLLTHLAMSLIEAGLDLGPIENQAEQWFADTPVAAAVAALGAQLARSAPSVVVVLDDAHVIPRATAVAVLQPLLAAAPPHVHFAIAGRTRPPLALAGLRARGELLELDAEALRFTDQELDALLPDVPAERRRLLAERTEGWPVALQLARLWLAARPDRVELIAGFSGRTAEVAEFLTEQVLGDLPSDVRTTLETTAPLESLSAGVVEAVTASPSAWPAVLAHESLAHLVVPVDDAREWYRLHPLLADYLRDRLHRSDPSRERECHARASVWFESQGRVRDAVRHAARAGDVPRAARLIEATGGWELVLFAGTALLDAILREIPTNRLAEFPRVELFRAFLDAKSGAIVDARRRYDEAARLIREHGEPAPGTLLRRDLKVVGHLVSHYEDRPVAPDALQRIHDELDELASGDLFARAALLNTACLSGLGLGRMEEARDACQRAVHEMRGLGSVLGLNYCALHLGLTVLHLGLRREAEAMFREALELAEENFGADSGLRALSDVHLAVALVARGELAAAEELFARSLGNVELYDGWLDVYAEGYGAAVAGALAVGDLARASAYAERAAATGVRRRLARLESLAEACRRRVAARRGETGVAEAWTAGAWRERPFHWREHHALGIASAEAALARGDVAAAQRVLDDLVAAAADGRRVRQGRQAAFLRAIADAANGDRDGAAERLLALVEAAAVEDDTVFLVESGPVAVPLLQHARQRGRDRGASTVARQVLGLALERLVQADPERSGGTTPALSARELEVLAELAQGAPNKVIARTLQMTENTVKFHLKNIFQKLGVRHRAQAIRAAHDHGLVR